MINGIYRYDVYLLRMCLLFFFEFVLGWKIIEAGLLFSGTLRHQQRAQKVVSDRLGLMDFAVCSYFFGRNSNYKG